MIYELRSYECVPGAIGKLNELMETLAVSTFARHGMRLIGAWTPEVGGNTGTLVYLLAYDDMGVRQRAWEAFRQDAEWKSGRAELAAKFGGPIVARTDSMLLAPTTYSPLT